MDATTPATCTLPGFTTHICSVCNAAQPQTEIPALGHNYVAAVVPPTCGAAGYTSHICSRCNDAQANTDPTPATGVHSFGPWTDTLDGANHEHTCTVCPAEEVAAHSPWTPGDTCTDCNAKKPPTAILTQFSPFAVVEGNPLGTFSTVYTIAWTGTPGVITATYTVNGGTPAAAVADNLGITTTVSVPSGIAGTYTVVTTLYSEGIEITSITVTLSVDVNNLPDTTP
ncbi:MAG: hypothetical protein RSG86_07745 [Oscillospiraceae bacterium]